jgi:hypothetical protein
MLDLFDIPGVMDNRNVFIGILAIWTLSLTQFVFLLSPSARKERFAFIEPEPKVHHADAETRKKSIKSHDQDKQPKCNKYEIGSLMMTLCLHDVPFVLMRLYVMITFKEISNTVLFFMMKNIYVIALEFYRMCIISCCPHDTEDEGLDAEDNRADNGTTTTAT